MTLTSQCKDEATVLRLHDDIHVLISCYHHFALSPSYCRLVVVVLTICSIFVCMRMLKEQNGQLFAWVIFIFISLDRSGRWGELRDDDTEILLQSDLVCARGDKFIHRKGCPLVHYVHPAFPPTVSTSTAL
ncbi:hypothetical protein DPMN_073386 [Dreissena polymorpha]|uniref:Uncharacterized protein n=1 Tax=Dreissena polymorpha TaxID=45954 RepID=A0A9D4HAY7_DREPO|nr:hypothetical protein DPMN_073386 [Dreissena polymorpha]